MYFFRFRPAWPWHPFWESKHDETLFTQGIFPLAAELFALHIGSARIPLMLMSYLGR